MCVDDFCLIQREKMLNQANIDLLITWHSLLLSKKIRTIVHICRFLVCCTSAFSEDKLMATKVANQMKGRKNDDRK